MRAHDCSPVGKSVVHVGKQPSRIEPEHFSARPWDSSVHIDIMNVPTSILYRFLPPGKSYLYTNFFLFPSLRKTLLCSQNPSTPPLRRLSLLIPFIKGHRASMISADIVQILDLVDPDYPIFTREGFFESIELRPFGGETRATDTILCLPGREKAVVVIIRHFVPEMKRVRC